MRFEQGAVEQVACAASDSMVFHNLPRNMVEHWICVYEFNEMLVRMLNCIEMDARVRNWILNPCATIFKHNNQDKVENQSTAQNNGTTTSVNPDNDWITPGRVFRHYRNSANSTPSRCENMCHVLTELVEEEKKHTESAKAENKKDKELEAMNMMCQEMN